MRRPRRRRFEKAHARIVVTESSPSRRVASRARTRRRVTDTSLSLARRPSSTTRVRRRARARRVAAVGECANECTNAHHARSRTARTRARTHAHDEHTVLDPHPCLSRARTVRPRPSSIDDAARCARTNGRRLDDLTTGRGYRHTRLTHPRAPIATRRCVHTHAHVPVVRERGWAPAAFGRSTVETVPIDGLVLEPTECPSIHYL